jgi:hypothetical protein
MGLHVATKKTAVSSETESSSQQRLLERLSKESSRQARWRERLSQEGRCVLRLTVHISTIEAIDALRGKNTRASFVEELVRTVRQTRLPRLRRKP